MEVGLTHVLWNLCFVLGPSAWETLSAPTKSEVSVPPRPDNQILPAFIVWIPGDSQSLCQILRLGSLVGDSEPSQTVEELLWYYCSGMRFDFIVFAPVLPSCCSFFFDFGHGVSYFGGFQHLPVDGCSIVSWDFCGLIGGDECTSFYSTILNQKCLKIFWWWIFWLI